jgi:hypothetical protein
MRLRPFPKRSVLWKVRCPIELSYLQNIMKGV